jgi:hypothetical protein
MSFKLSTPQAIRSASLRALANHWDELTAGRRFPALTELKAVGDLHDTRQLVVWNVEGQGRLRKFRALYQGEYVAEAFNSDWAGMTMEMVVPMSLRRIALDAAKECATSGCLVYTIFSTIDASDQRVDCERLLLPFGHDSKVEQLVSSLQLTVVRGRARILKHFEMQTEMLLEVRIKSGFTATAQSGDGQDAAKADGKAAGEKRRAPRRDVKRTARIHFARKNMTCIVRNLSATGAAIEVPDFTGIPDHFGLTLEMESVERRCQVMWRRKSRIGIRFS